MKTLKSPRTLIHHRTVLLATLGAGVFVAQTACSEAPQQQNTPTFAGTPSVLPSAGNTAGGTPGSAGTFTTSGTGFGTAGDTAVGGTGGTGGDATAGAAGTAGTAAGTAGTGGTPPVVVVPPFCEGKTPDPLPFEVTTAFYESAWQGDFTQITAVPATDNTPDPCAADQRTAGAKGGCSRWRYTPAVAGATWAAVAWVNMADANFTHPPVCLATGATRISFYARGKVGGEVISVGGGSANEVAITLTTEWKEYEVPLEGVQYSTPNGVAPNGFSWKVDPPIAPAVAPIVEFFIDNIHYVTTPLVGNDPGGEGGAGGGGG